MGIFGFKSSKNNKEQNEVVAPQNNGFSGGHLKFAIPYFDVFDPRLTDYGVPVAVHGSVVYAVEDQELFRRINGEGCAEEAFNQKLKSTLAKYIKGVVSNAPYEEQIPVVQLERKIMSLSDLVQMKARPQIENVLGIRVLSLDISNIIIDKDSKGYVELRSLTADLEKENVLAKHSASLSNFNLHNTLQEDQLKVQSSLELDSLKRKHELELGQQEEAQRIQLENQKETMRIQREEMQRAARLQTEQTFLEAHRLDVSEGLSATAQPPQLPKEDPDVQYYIGVNGRQAGPFGIEQMKNLATRGQLTANTYVWTPGMENWKHAREITGLADLFSRIIPPMPPKLPSD